MEKEKANEQAQEEIEDTYEYIKKMHFGDIKRKYYEDYPDCEDSIDWVVEQYQKGVIRTESNVLNVDAQKCDIFIKYCSNCDKCWELLLSTDSSIKKERIYYYIDFTKYDREIELCPRCQDSQVKSTTEN